MPADPMTHRAPPDLAVLARLEAAIEARRGADPSVSHSARLLGRGTVKCAQKFGEEAVEAALAAVAEDRKALVGECADVLYHLLVMLAARRVPLAEVMAELEAREGTSGVTEKATRKRP